MNVIYVKEVRTTVSRFKYDIKTIKKIEMKISYFNLLKYFLKDHSNSCKAVLRLNTMIVFKTKIEALSTYIYGVVIARKFEIKVK